MIVASQSPNTIAVGVTTGAIDLATLDALDCTPLEVELRACVPRNDKRFHWYGSPADLDTPVR